MSSRLPGRESATDEPSAMDLQNLAKIFGVDVSIFSPESKTERKPIKALQSAQGELGPKDIDEVTQYAQFRRARHELGAAKRSRKK